MRTNRTMSVFACIAASAVSTVAFGQTASAPTDMNLSVSIPGVRSWNWQSADRPGTWTQDDTNERLWNLLGQAQNSDFKIDFSVDVDPDPFVSNAFTLTNNTAFTQTFSVTVTLPVMPAVPAFTQTFGSLSGSIIDGNGNGFAEAKTTGAGSAFYTSFIDGVQYQQLAPHATTFTAGGFPGATNAIGPMNYLFLSGQPGVNTSMSITNTFTLTAGDSLQLVSSFFLAPEIPAPGAMGLLAVGGLMAARRRR